MNKPSESIINEVLAGAASHKNAEWVAKWFATPSGQEYLSLRMNHDFLELKEIEDEKLSYLIPSESLWKKIERRTFYKKRRINLMLRLVVVFILFSIILLTVVLVSI